MGTSALQLRHLLLLLPAVLDLLFLGWYLLNLLLLLCSGLARQCLYVATQVKDLLDLLFLEWYLLNLLFSGVARQCLYIATQVKDLLVLLAAL